MCIENHLNLDVVYCAGGIDARTIRVGWVAEICHAHFPSMPTSTCLIQWRWWRVVNRTRNRWLVRDHLMIQPLTGTYITLLLCFGYNVILTFTVFGGNRLCFSCCKHTCHPNILFVAHNVFCLNVFLSNCLFTLVLKRRQCSPVHVPRGSCKLKQLLVLPSLHNSWSELQEYWYNIFTKRDMWFPVFPTCSA